MRRSNERNRKIKGEFEIVREIFNKVENVFEQKMNLSIESNNICFNTLVEPSAFLKYPRRSSLWHFWLLWT